jgi:SNF2 family DNA or RNA helicase
MKEYNKWLLLRLVESDDQLISGKGIDLLKNTIHDMASRGAPNEYDDDGFNKTDWTTFSQLSHYLNQPAIPARVATTFLRILSRYKNTQVTNYEQISKLVNTDFQNSSHATQQKGMDEEKIHIYNEPLSYGKVKVYIPHGVDLSETRGINKIIDQKFEEEKASKEQDIYGKWNYPRFKKFSKDKNNPNIFFIHGDILSAVIELLKTRRNIEITGNIPAEVDSLGQQQQQQEVVILGKVRTPYGEKLKVQFNVPYEKQPWATIKAKNLSPRGAIYSNSDHNSGVKGVILINIEDKSLFDAVRDVIASKGINVEPLNDWEKTNFGNHEVDAAAEKRPEKSSHLPSEEEGLEARKEIKAIEFSDLPADKMKVKVDYRHPMLAGNDGKKNFIKELIQYTFPEYTWNKLGYFYEVQGNYQQFASFGKLLKRFGYNVDQLRDVLKVKLISNRIAKDKYHGQYDSDDNYEKLEKDMEENLPNNTYELYKQQKEGVGFLYGRHHAILGDETGFGKTVQLITAAALRMKKEIHPTLIISLKSTQQQWIDTIKSVAGDEEVHNISTNGAMPKKWTVLYYENFSAGKNLKNVIEECKKAGFGIAILDELHKLKHETSKRSQNIAEVLENIPTVWGASATVSANKPMDVKNQLRIVKHHLGKISDSKFKKDFAGQDYRGAHEEGDDKSLEAAERLNRWLNLSGLYVRRSKDDLREMPTLHRREISPTNVNEAEFNQKYLSKLSNYEDPNLPISKMIAAREVVAQLKTDNTVNKVTKIISDNMNNPANNYAASKVVVFTNFIESANQLVSKLSASLRNIDPNFKVITYLANTKKKERSQVKANFTNDPNAKVLVMSMKMGGTGIDFPNAAQNMVVNDFDWTPESAEQSEGRIYRINTNHPVNIDYTIAHGIDAKLFEKVQQKRKLAAIVQQHRKEYHQKEHDPETLHKIIMAQKQINSIDNDIAGIIANELPSERKESFRDFFGKNEEFRKMLFTAYS